MAFWELTERDHNSVTAILPYQEHLGDCRSHRTPHDRVLPGGKEQGVQSALWSREMNGGWHEPRLGKMDASSWAVRQHNVQGFALGSHRGGGDLVGGHLSFVRLDIAEVEKVKQVEDFRYGI